MAFNGYKNNEIAERLGMAPSTVSTIIRSPLGQAYLEGLQDRAQEATLDVRKKLVSLNKNALETFERLLDPKQKAPHSVQFNTAKDVLDRNGYKAPEHLMVDMTFQTKSDEELEAEITAMEKSLGRHPESHNLPKIDNKNSLDETSSQTPLDSDITTTLEGCDVDEHYNSDELDLGENFNEDYFGDIPDLSEVLESPEVVMPELLDSAADIPDELLKDISFNPFHNIKEPL